MWRFLLQAGLGLATLNVGGKIARLKRTAALLAVAGVLALLGLSVLLAAAVILLEPRFGAAAAAGIVGGATLVVALLFASAATWEPRRRVMDAPVVNRVRSELKAAGDALSSPRTPRLGGSGGKRNLNIVLIATLAGIVLGRRL